VSNFTYYLEKVLEEDKEEKKEKKPKSKLKKILGKLKKDETADLKNQRTQVTAVRG